MLKWDKHLQAVQDDRPRPQIPTRAIVRALVVMFLGRLGSLHALEQTRPSSFWRTWLGTRLPSADSMGRICSLMDLQGLREVIHHVYTRLKRTKALEPPPHGLMLAVLDGHETTSSRKRCCPGCCRRIVHTKRGDVVEYYHRYAVLRLVGGRLSMMLDAEPVAPGEDELAAARRLLERVLAMYPRAFDVVAGDALYANTQWFRFVVSRGKDALAVLKDNRPNLIDDARSLFAALAGIELSAGKVNRLCWDFDGFTAWPELAEQVRVVRSLETRMVRRQLTGQLEQMRSDWMWVTTLSQSRASTQAVVNMGHERWSIENQGFNELANRWHSGHVYKHHPTAMLAFYLLAMLCLNVFTAFYSRNLQPAARRAMNTLHISRLIVSELYESIRDGPVRHPP